MAANSKIHRRSTAPERGPIRDEQARVQSVVRALDIVAALDSGPRPLDVLADAAGVTLATARRLLATLADARLVIGDPATSSYALGPACFDVLDAVAHGAGGLGVLAQDMLVDLSRTTGETVAVYVRAGPQRVCVAQVASPRPVSYAAQLGMEKPVNTGAMGKVLLAFSEPHELAEILDRTPLQAWTPSSITDREQLELELAKIRRLGIATSRGEQTPGVAAVAVPVTDLASRLVAALSVLGPADRLTPAAIRSIEPHLRAAAATIEGRLAALHQPGGA